MRCQNCHQTVPDTAKVCGYCGSKLDKEAMFPCPSCKEQIPVTAKVCGYCGTRIADFEAQPAPVREPVKAKKTKETRFSRKKEKAPEKPKKTVKKEIAKKSESPKKAEKPVAKKSQRKPLPKWLIPAGLIIFAAAAIAVVVLMVVPGSRNIETIYFACDQEIVKAGDELIVYYYWTAKEPQQVDAFFDAADHYVSVNDVWYKIRRSGLDEMRFDEKTGGYKRRYWMNIGTLKEPGWYAINTIVDINSQVFDGWDYFGPGTSTTRLDQTCAVRVVE